MVRRRRRVVAGLSVTALLALTVAAVMVARSARTPGQIASSAALPRPSTVTADVTGERLALKVVATGTLSERVVATLTAPQSPAPEGSLPVLTRVQLAAGNRFRFGAAIAEVSGRPLLVLPGRFPLYRDIHRGDDGPDVLQLRQGLVAVGFARFADSTWDADAEQSLRRLYAQQGYPLGQGPAASPAPARPPALVVRRAEILFAPGAVRGVYCGVKGKVGAAAEGTLAAVCSEDLRFEGAVIDATPDGALPAEGQSGTGRLSGETDRDVAVRWTRIGAPAGGDKQQGPRFRAQQVPRRGLRVGESSRLTITLARSKPGDVVVPVSALWTRDGAEGVYAGPGGNRWVPVQVRFSADARAVVRSDALHAGDVVALTSPTAIGGASAGE
jgi:hypothetical protein